MTRLRIKYFLLIGVIIILGLLSRRFTVFPMWIGDVLWATMVYFMVRFFFVRPPIIRIALISIIISYAIEFSQLYKAEWIDSLRNTFLGQKILGDTFFWGDLLAYTAGILLGVVIDIFITKKILEKR